MALQHHHVFGKFACLSTSFQDLSEDTPDECLIIEQIRKDRTFKPAGAAGDRDVHDRIGGEPGRHRGVGRGRPAGQARLGRRAT